MTQQPTIRIGTRVYLSDGRAGWIRTKPPSWDFYDVLLDNGDMQTIWVNDLRPETFKEFVLNRPDRVGNWSALEFIGIQSGIAIGALIGTMTLFQGGWIALALLAGIEGIIYYGLRRNYKGLQA